MQNIHQIFPRYSQTVLIHFTQELTTMILMRHLDFKKLECANLLFPQRARITDHEDDDSDDADDDVGK